MDAMDLVVMSYVIMNTSLYPICELFSCPLLMSQHPNNTMMMDLIYRLKKLEKRSLIDCGSKSL
jgi:hypothetical protein